MPQDPHSQTRDRVLAQAEGLFAERGFKQTTLRDITQAAKVNLAAVNYYFGSKEALLRAIIATRVGPINRERLSLLKAARDEAAPGPVPLEAIFRAFLVPMFTEAEQSVKSRMVRVVAHAMRDVPGFADEIFTNHFQEIHRAFTAALHLALPSIPPGEMAWRFHFAIKLTVAVAVNDLKPPAQIGICVEDPDSAIPRLVEFICGGFMAAEAAHANTPVGHGPGVPIPGEHPTNEH